MTRDEALRLQININDILRGAKAEPDDVRNAMGAINWGDLLCTDIELRRSLSRDDVKIETEW